MNKKWQKHKPESNGYYGKNIRYYATSQYKWIMKYMEGQISLWCRRINVCQIINFACLYDGRVDTRELEQTNHYQDLA